MRVEDYRFGHIRINGQTYRNDVKIIQDAVKPEWWRKNGHLVRRQDLSDILAAEPEILVIGKGASGQMALDKGLAEELEKEGIRLIAAPTAEAVSEFNRLSGENRRVAAGFHLTC